MPRTDMARRNHSSEGQGVSQVRHHLATVCVVSLCVGTPSHAARIHPHTHTHTLWSNSSADGHMLLKVQTASLDDILCQEDRELD